MNRTSIRKKTLLTFIAILIVINGLAQEHPWEKYGFKPKTITLSKGKYQEFHDNDTIVEIGSAVFDRKNGKIIGAVKADTSKNYEVMKPYIISRWVCPDPLAEEYPDWTPYRYGFNNPILFIDPNGMLEDNYGIDKDGNITLLEETDDEYDVLYAVDDDGNKQDTNNDGEVSESDGAKVNDQSILSQLAEDTGIKDPWGTKNVSFAKTNSKSDVFNVFSFAANNSDVEWQLDGYDIGNGKTDYVIGTAHDGDHSIRTDDKYYGLGYKLRNQNFAIHSHPNTNEPPSGGDISNWYGKYKDLKGIRGPAPHYVYNIWHQILWSYDSYSGSGIKHVRTVKKASDLYRKLGF